MDNVFCNKVMHAFTSRENPLYDMLYLYGQPTSIKLFLDTLEEKYIQAHPTGQVIRTNATDFINETYEQILRGASYSMPQCDLYIFEEIDDLSGKETNEQKLYGILDWLLENKKQIIITGSAPTAELTSLASRIQAQIDGGISLLVK